MSTPLSEIVQINIDVRTPVAGSASFDNLLIVGPPPAIAPDKPPVPVGVYNNLKALEEAGFVSTGDTADPIGVAVRVAFSQNPGPARVFVAVQQTTETQVLESVVDTLRRALDTTGWYVICPAGVPESDYQNIAEWTEAQTKMFAYTFLSATDPTGAIFFRSHGWCGLVTDNQVPADVPQANHYVHVAAVAKTLAFPSGSETWAHQSVSGVFPAQTSSTFRKVLEDGHSNYIRSVESRTLTFPGKMRGGEWIDVVRGRDWLENDMQLRIFNLLLMHSKIPYTDSGISLVHNQMIASLKSAQTRGIVAEDEYDEYGVLIPGFTTRVPRAANISPGQKASRLLNGCTFEARLAGAIHLVRIDGALTY